MSFCEKAEWIECKECEAPEFLKEFRLDKKPENAKISICGLGFFELKINGKKVSEDLLVPAWSEYEPRDLSNAVYPIFDTFTYRVYYMEYDVSEYLVKGNNTLAVVLGNGWYNNYMRKAEGDLKFGTPKLCFDLFVDGVHIVSDEDVRASQTEIVFNNVHYGETQDFRIKKSYSLKVTKAEKPTGELTRQDCPTDKVHRVIYPEKIGSVDGRDIYDCKENISGWAVFFQNGKAGDKTVVRYSEEISDGRPDFLSTGSDYKSDDGKEQIQTDCYISDGEKNVCRPKFTFHAFRYLEIEGKYEDLAVEVVYADVDRIAEFECSDEIINKVFDNFIRTQLDNMHSGVPSDCPHRERLGYTGDGQLVCDLAMHTLDCRKFYKKWIQDIADCQDVNNGHVQHTAPFFGGGGGPGGWGCAIVYVPYFYYKNYRDKEIIEKYFPNMKKWCEYIKSRSQNGLVVREEEGGWCLGDWGFSENVLIPEPFVNTYFFIKSLGYMEEMADVISADKTDISILKQKVSEAFVREYYDEKTNSVLNKIQGAEAFFVDLGLGNEDMIKNLNQHYQDIDVFDTGIFGTDILVRVLFENGYQDTAVKLIRNSFAPQIKHGATTLWEYWNGKQSHNHPMYGACVKYLITELMGIKKGETLLIEPKPSALIEKVGIKIKIDEKEVRVSYEIKGGKTLIKVFSEQKAEFSYNNENYTLAENEEKLFVF